MRDYEFLFQNIHSNVNFEKGNSFLFGIRENLLASHASFFSNPQYMNTLTLKGEKKGNVPCLGNIYRTDNIAWSYCSCTLASEPRLYLKMLKVVYALSLLYAT